MVAWMVTVLPTASPPTEENSVPGPKRQLGASVFGVTIGVAEVGLDADVGVSKGPEGGGTGVKEGMKSMTGAMNRLKEVGRAGFEATGTG